LLHFPCRCCCCCCCCCGATFH